MTILSDEFTDDPLVRGYNGPGSENPGPGPMTDEEALTSINAITRPDLVPLSEVGTFITTEQYFTDGNDLIARSIRQRMLDVTALSDGVTAKSTVANPWESLSIGQISTADQNAVHELLGLFRVSEQTDSPVDFQNPVYIGYANGAQSAGCMSIPQRDALLALGDNRQSRASELLIPTPNLGDVEAARL